MSRRALVSLAAAATSLFCLPAAAATFAADGTLLFDAEAAATFDFEDGVALTEGGQVTADPSALSGGKVLTLAQFAGSELEVVLPAQPRTYRVSLWFRGGETVGDLEISYSDRPEELAALYPTGRVTSDGWVELANDRVRVDGSRVTRVAVGLFSPAGAQVDAVEVTPDGELPPGEPNATCRGVADASACAPDQVCMWSVCRNVDAWVPPIPADREDVTDYLEARLRLLFGPFAERTLDLPNALVAIEQMRAADDRWTYWNGFMLAVRRLHDGHTTTSGLSDFVLENPKPMSVCFLEGEADLTQGAAPKDASYLDVLVSHTGADHNLGLSRGDRLVRIDGQHPIAWARGLTAYHWSQPAISNHVTYAEIASRLRSLIPRFAHEIEVVRCNGGASCGPVETISITDLPAEPPGTPVEVVTCDNRPLRHLPTSPVDHASAGEGVFSGIVIESNDTEKIHGLEWESLFVTQGSALGAALGGAVSSWKSQGARGVILDHRKGTGGTNAGSEILWNYAVPRHASTYYQDRQRAEDEQPSLEDGIVAFQHGVDTGLVEYAGSVVPVTHVPVALLLTEDVSASDWLPFGMKGAPKVRLFGPFQTNGAFSTRYSFGYWLSMSYVIATGDTYAPDGSTLNGSGVTPDVVVLPKQSDLVAGKDTVFEAALGWVRQELAP
jgi:hypothetical protein